MICPKCKKEIPAGSNICPACYSDLTKYHLSSEPQVQEAPRGGAARGNAAPRGRAPQQPQGVRRRPGAQANPQAIMVAAGLVVVFLVLLILLLRAIFGGGGTGTPGPGAVITTAEPTPTFQIFGVDTNTPEPTVTPDPLEDLQIQITPEPTQTPEPVYATLKKGSTGDDVKRMQEALIALGYLEDGGADGDYGNGTVSAVKKFQTDNKLSADGQAGTQTLTTLYRLYGGDIDTTGSTGTAGAAPAGSSQGGGTSGGQILDQPG